jgi:hypothetical protein
MADLTNLESKIGEVAGLAMAAKAATSKIMTIARNDDHDELVQLLEQMNSEAEETEARCTALAGAFEGKKTAIIEEARATKDKGSSMLKTYLDDDADALDGFEFLTMAEAGEVGHWEVLKELASTAQAANVLELTDWALPIQQRHFDEARSIAAKLAATENPNEVD